MTMKELAERVLLPCPFCGSDGELFVRGFTDDRADAGNAYIGCDTCGVEQPYKRSPTEAVAAWNTRASQEHTR
jgi:Lar family restriction alleviation protein